MDNRQLFFAGGGLQGNGTSMDRTFFGIRATQANAAVFSERLGTIRFHHLRTYVRILFRRRKRPQKTPPEHRWKHEQLNITYVRT